MTKVTEELFKAIFAVGIFGCACGLVRLALIDQLHARIKLVVGGFLALMLLPTTYLYLRLAFPSSAAALLPFQSMAIWVYGPLLMVVLHVVANRRMYSWQAGILSAPLLLNVVVQISFVAWQRPLPAWWELLSIAQASVFAVAAIGWTLRARTQLRVVLRGFSGSSFGALLYLSTGLLALLLTDFFVHWRFYAGMPLSPLALYLVVSPSALYALVISMALIWRNPRPDPEIEELEMPPPSPAAQNPDTSPHTPLAAQVPVSTPQMPVSEPPVPSPAPQIPAPTLQVPIPAPSIVQAQVRDLELSPVAARELQRHLDGLMREESLYKRNDLTLADLAAALRVSTHLASELLNAHLNSGFYEFLNRHRADEAARLLRAGKGGLSITDIAYQAGFNNPNTFYREFKRVHGVTPAQFRRAGAVTIPRSNGSVDEGLAQ